MVQRNTTTVNFDFTGITAGITYSPVVIAEAIPSDEALYLNSLWIRSHGVSATIAPATSLLEFGLAPDPAKDPGFTRSSFYFTNFTGFVTGAIDPIALNPVRWEEPDLFAYVRWVGPDVPTVRWHAELVIAYSLLPRPLSETARGLARTPFVVWPPIGNVQIGGL